MHEDRVVEETEKRMKNFLLYDFIKVLVIKELIGPRSKMLNRNIKLEKNESINDMMLNTF